MSSRSEAVKKWRRNTKERIITAMGGKCACCGYNKCHDAMDLHHLNPNEKEFSFAAIRANPKNWDSIVQELRKCVLLCNRCHREIHSGVTKLPNNYTKFNEEYANYKRIGKYDDCPICGTEKPVRNKTCSPSCSAKLQCRVNWEEIDLHDMIEVQKLSYVKISEILDVSDVTVRKRYLKLKELSL